MTNSSLFKIINNLFLFSFLTIFLLVPISRQVNAEQREPIKVGALMVLTGQFAMQGAAFNEGIKIAEEEINQSGGINGIPLRVIVEDTKGTPQGAATAARKLISVDKVIAALTMSYPDTKVGGVAFQRAKIPSIALWDSSPEIDDMGEFIFSVGPWAPSTGEGAAKFGFTNLNAETSVIVNTVEEWSAYVSDYYTKEFEKLGGKVLKRYEVNPEDSDFKTILGSIKKINPKLIFVPITHNIIPFFKQLKVANVNSKIITGAIVTKEHVSQVPSIFEGVYRSEIRDPDSRKAKELFKVYKNKFKKSVTLPWYVATGYDSVKLLAKSIKESSIKSKSLKDYLYTVKNFTGASKVISISSGGSAPTFEKIFKISNGKFIFIK